MKKLFTILAAVLLTASVFAQSTQKMSYQAVIRNSGGTLVTSTAVGMQISILQGSETGTVVYTETQTPTTNANGLVSIEIGDGTGFSSINWSTGNYYIKTETDPTGGTNYSITGSSQLLSVPYALHAKTAESIINILAIGDSYGGGIIFWLDATGQHGLIAATADQSTGIRWYNGSYTITNAVRDGIGAGMYNTERIIANQSTGSYAAQLCANYQGGGYGDWYLPSIYELNLLYLQKNTVGGFASADYWSSTEYDNYDARIQSFANRYQYARSKDYAYYVRAVRAF